MKQVLMLVAVFGIALAASPLSAYEEAPVTDGGTITGKVLMKGEEPPAKAYNLVLFPEPAYCGRISTGTGWRLLDEFQVAPDGGLQNVVVMLEGVKKGKAFEYTDPEVDARDCKFNPRVMVVRDQHKISVVNMDPIIHDIQIYEVAPNGSAVMLHRPLRLNPYHPKADAGDHEHRPGELLTDTVQFTKGRRIFFLECGFHAYMQAWGVSVDNPYYAITDTQGHFTLTDVPQGVYTLVAWHPGLRGILSTEVAILKGELVTSRFEFDAPKAYTNAETTMVEHPHYDVDALGKVSEAPEILPTHKLQTP